MLFSLWLLGEGHCQINALNCLLRAQGYNQDINYRFILYAEIFK